jgi:hypothetical protein
MKERTECPIQVQVWKLKNFRIWPLLLLWIFQISEKGRGKGVPLKYYGKKERTNGPVRLGLVRNWPLSRGLHFILYPILDKNSKEPYSKVRPKPVFVSWPLYRTGNCSIQRIPITASDSELQENSHSLRIKHAKELLDVDPKKFVYAGEVCYS